MAEEPRGKRVKGTVGVLGILATMASVWWFALRPRRKKREQ